ncbi:MalY/PatB family protein [uncultured Methanobrevibacter sp.]|uniref:MalY/PatB family protein n=1 Tax=uncultured Methanobrevibacter sp. TaxID=253161 RepID=UPI00262C75A7
MKHDFDSIVNRKNTNSLKWDLFNDEIPMWVADMDFKAAPKIYEEVNKRAQQDVYGYSIVPDEYFDSYINWWKKYGLEMKRENLLFSISVMPAITSIIRAFTSIGDKILLQSPVYHVFYHVIENNNREVVENQLIYNNSTDDVDLAYTIDFEDLEKKLSDDDTKMMLLCNPHNPVGKIWKREDLIKIADLCEKHDVILVSDEIHCDLTDPGETYIPLASVSDYKNVFTTLSPSKTFNIAGLQNAVVFTENEEFYELLSQQLTSDFFSQSNIFAIDCAIAAYESEDWLNELREYLFENKKLVNSFLSENIPEIKLVPANATYLLWLDCEALNSDSNTVSTFLREKVGLFLSPGCQFGSGGDNFLRLNIACPREILEEGLNALKEGIRLFLEK